ncbi:MAG: CHAT domain-containing protein [Sphingomonas sp.]
MNGSPSSGQVLSQSQCEGLAQPPNYTARGDLLSDAFFLAPAVRALTPEIIAAEQRTASALTDAMSRGNKFQWAAAAKAQFDLLLGVFGSSHPTTLKSQSNMAFVAGLIGDRVTAERLLPSAYNGLLTRLGPASTDTRIAQFNYQLYLVRAGRCSEARKLKNDFDARLSQWEAAPRETLTEAEARQCSVILARGAPLPRQLVRSALVRSMVKGNPALSTRLPTGAAADDIVKRTGELTAVGETLQTLPGLERDTRKLLADAKAVFGESTEPYALIEVYLGSILEDQGRASEAVGLLSHSFLVLAGLGSGKVDDAYFFLIRALIASSRCGDALALTKGTLPSEASALLKPASSMATSVATPLTFDNMPLGQLKELLNAGRTAEAVTLGRETTSRARESGSPTLQALANMLLGAALEADGRLGEAEQLLRQPTLDVATGWQESGQGYQVLGLLELQRGAFDSAARIFRPIAEKMVAAGNPAGTESVNLLTGALIGAGRLGEAESWAGKAITLAGTQPENALIAARAFDILGDISAASDDYARAETAYASGIRQIDAQAGARFRQGAGLRSVMRYKRAVMLEGLGRHGEAVSESRGAVQKSPASASLTPAQKSIQQMRIAHVELIGGQYASAVQRLRPLCSGLGGLAAGDLLQSTIESDCATLLALGLNGVAVSGGARAAGFNEAFVVAQRSEVSRAGAAIARAGARRTLAGDGAALVDRYEAALARRTAIDRAIAAASGGGDTAALRALGDRRAEEDRIAAEAMAEISRRYPRYWDLVRPAPVPATEFQRPSSSLLRPDEALLIWMIPRGPEKGLAFAVSRDRAGWAEIALSGAEIKNRVMKLRAAIAASRSAPAGAGRDTKGAGFDRQAAYELYQALLGSPAIQAVISDKPSLIIAPAGPMTSLPPAVLVTKPPAGGTRADADPETLRATPWLLRSKALTVVPSAASLKTLRETPTTASNRPRDALLAFADPDFGGRDGQKVPVPVAVRGFADYYDDEVPLADAIRSLPRLPGTLIEAEALRRTVGGRAQDILGGRAATKAALFERSNDGRLANVRVVDFATHGLVAGEMRGLAEPALVLAAGKKPEDSLLTASEAAGLRFNADWVLLSACSTASADYPGAGGLSGLARAFFFAGARSLLVSHWRIRDDIAARLVPTVIRAQYASGLGRAEALQQASLAVLDDPRLDAADPAAWAPFVLVGVPER